MLNAPPIVVLGAVTVFAERLEGELIAGIAQPMSLSVNSSVRRSP